MMKKIISLALCLLMVVSIFAGCAQEKDENDKGAYIRMYISDPVYNFDPAAAYGNDSALKVISLMFDNLFVLNENGKVKKSLAKDYEIKENDETQEYSMIITLNDTSWSDGTAVSANDVVYSWKRILDESNSYEAAALLYDIKNAKEAKEGEMSIDDVRIYALNETQVEIFFVGKIDYDAFLLNLTSYALAPLREDVVNQAINAYDWAKSPTIFLASGPFKLREISHTEEGAGLVLERNLYYYRNGVKDAIDESVTPYRLIVDYTMSDEEIKAAYDNGELFFIGDIPLSLRGALKDSAEVSNALSTHTYVLNENAIIKKVDGSEGSAIFANANVRKALSAAIDRNAIAEAVVFAEAATGLVPNGVFDHGKKKDMFREVGGAMLSTGANMGEAKSLLGASGIIASDYEFSISVAAYDDVHVKIAEMVCAAWNELGFKVSVNTVNVIDNKHYDKTTNDVIPGIKDDVFAESYDAGNFEVAAIDCTAFSADAFSMLAPFAKYYTGRSTNANLTTGAIIPTHISGYNNDTYNGMIDSAFKATDAKEKANILHEAERTLLEDMPIIPIVFNKNAYVVSDELSKCEFTYYGSPLFSKVKLKDYELYLPETSA